MSFNRPTGKRNKVTFGDRTRNAATLESNAIDINDDIRIDTYVEAIRARVEIAISDSECPQIDIILAACCVGTSVECPKDIVAKTGAEHDAVDTPCGTIVIVGGFAVAYVLAALPRQNVIATDARQDIITCAAGQRINASAKPRETIALALVGCESICSGETSFANLLSQPHRFVFMHGLNSPSGTSFNQFENSLCGLLNSLLNCSRKMLTLRAAALGATRSRRLRAGFLNGG